jgi:putative flavoprotein involved in K+ transport
MLDLRSAGVTSIVWATGYDFDASWVRADVFDDRGFPIQDHGATAVPGLYFAGMHWASRPVSAFVGGAGPEAEAIASHIASRRRQLASSS